MHLFKDALRLCSIERKNGTENAMRSKPLDRRHSLQLGDKLLACFGAGEQQIEQKSLYSPRRLGRNSGGSLAPVRSRFAKILQAPSPVHAEIPCNVIGH